MDGAETKTSLFIATQFSLLADLVAAALFLPAGSLGSGFLADSKARLLTGAIAVADSRGLALLTGKK